MARTVQALFLVLLVAWLGLSIHAMLHPRDAFSTWTDAFFVHGYLLLVQLVYPLFAWFTRKHTWSGGWRLLRLVQGGAVAAIVLGFLLLLLATPDVSGFSS